jgi:hypothetical protein
MRLRDFPSEKASRSRNKNLLELSTLPIGQSLDGLTQLRDLGSNKLPREILQLVRSQFPLITTETAGQSLASGKTRRRATVGCVPIIRLFSNLPQQQQRIECRGE